MPKEFLYLISKDDLEPKTLESYIYPNLKTNYYLSSDLSPSFYILLSYYGFISTSTKIENRFYLLPEIQFEYAILDFSNLHICKKVENLLKKSNYIFSINRDLNQVLQKIGEYHKDSWLEKEYIDLILNLANYKDENIDFKLLSVELYDKYSNELISGEIGYKIGKTYTSLTGFSSKEKKYNNWGKQQMVLLAKYLENHDFDFWNLGHPYMQYKFDLGATLYSREEFLKRWQASINLRNNR